MKTLKYILGAFLLLTAVFSCTEKEFGNIDFVKTLTPPSNITAYFSATQDNTGLVTILPNGDGVSSFEINFGDGTEETMELNSGEYAMHTYTEGTYNVKISGLGTTGLTTEATQELVVSFKAPENVEVVISNDEAVSKKVNVVANADYAISYDVYFGEEGNDEPVSANIGETASYVYKEAGTYSIRTVVKSAAIETVEDIQEFTAIAIVQPTTPATTPQPRNASDVISLYGDAYTNVADIDFNPDWGQSGQGSGFAEFDLNGDKMLQYINLSYQGIALAEGTSIDVSAMEYLHLDVWTADVTTLETSLISEASGEKPFTNNLTADAWTSIDILVSDYIDQGLTVNDIIQLKLVGDPWAAGTVFIDNIYFYVSTPSSPVTGAPVPTQNESVVTSIFSDSYTDITVSEWNPGWGQTTVLTEVDIAGNNTLKYEALDFTGIVTDYDNPTDVSNRTHVHFDYWTNDATSLSLKLVNTAYDDGDPLKETEVALPSITIGSWVSIDIPLTDFTTDMSGITQMLFGSSSSTVYIDNFYFYTELANDPVVGANAPTVDAANVVSIFSDEYTNVDVSEWNPGWGQATVLTSVDFDGNNVLKYESLDFTGIVTDYDNPTDVSSQTHVHFDYWTIDASSLSLKLVNTTHGDGDPLKEAEVAVSEISLGTWVSVDIPLSDYSTDMSGITQLLFVSSSAKVYIDNIYFY
jgi:hypothetical protein